MILYIMILSFLDPLRSHRPVALGIHDAQEAEGFGAGQVAELMDLSRPHVHGVPEADFVQLLAERILTGAAQYHTHVLVDMMFQRGVPAGSHLEIAHVKSRRFPGLAYQRLAEYAAVVLR